MDALFTVVQGQSAIDLASKYTLDPAYSIAILNYNNFDPSYGTSTPLPTGVAIRIPSTWLKAGGGDSGGFLGLDKMPPALMIGAGLVIVWLALSGDRKR